MALEDDPYVWIDPFEEIAKERRRADRSYMLGETTARAQMENMLTGRMSDVLRDVWHNMAGSILRDVVKPFAKEWGDKAVAGVAEHLTVGMARDLARDDVVVQAVIQPFRVEARIDAMSVADWR